MHIVATSDLHGHLPVIPECDLLIIGGDVTPVENHDRKYQADWIRGTFAEWLDEQPAEVITWVGGNHDFVLQDWRNKRQKLINIPGLYLDNEVGDIYVSEKLEVKSLKIYGTPMSNRFGDWAFMAEEDKLREIYKQIPRDIDILITHGPPFGHGDLIPAVSWSASKRGWDNLAHGERVGSTSLLNQLQYEDWPNLKFVVTGHIHEDYGKHMLKMIDGREVPVYNVAHMDGGYNPNNLPVEIEL